MGFCLHTDASVANGKRKRTQAGFTIAAVYKELEDDEELSHNDVTELQVAKRECERLGTELRSMKPSRYRPIDVKFRDVFVSLRAYMKNFGNEKRVLSLAKRLYDNVAMSQEEAHWQQSTAKFIESMSQNFELPYCDVVTPVRIVCHITS